MVILGHLWNHWFAWGSRTFYNLKKKKSTVTHSSGTVGLVWWVLAQRASTPLATFCLPGDWCKPPLSCCFSTLILDILLGVSENVAVVVSQFSFSGTLIYKTLVFTFLLYFQVFPQTLSLAGRYLLFLFPSVRYLREYLKRGNACQTNNPRCICMFFSPILTHAFVIWLTVA